MSPCKRISRSWDPVAGWYSGWSGAHGSHYHRRLAIPALLELLQPVAGERILDVGCGPAALARHIVRAGARYVGVDSSRRLLEFARRHHGKMGEFVLADATRLASCRELTRGSFDAVVFLLSIQDIDPLDAAIESAAWALRPGGRLVMLMTHPCFRVPRQSGWVWDTKRRLHSRRVDRYLTPLEVPMKPYGGNRRGATRSYHRPLSAYFDALSRVGIVVDRLVEIPDRAGSPSNVIRRVSDQEIPLFLGIRGTLRQGV